MRKEIDYKVFVGGKEIELFRVAVSYTPEKDEPPVYASRFDDDGNCYGIGSFDSDEPVQVEIRCKRSLAQTVILPALSSQTMHKCLQVFLKLLQFICGFGIL